MNTVELWKQRFQLYIKELRTYGKYVFNDHLKFVLIFAIGVGAYYYQQWLATLTSSFPAAFLIAVLFAFVLTIGSVQTLLKPADVVFLLPVEERMKPYFRRAFRLSYLIQLYGICMLGAALAPLYFQQVKQSASMYFLLLVLIILAKLWNLLAAWECTYATEERIRLYDWLLRFSVNVLFVYCLISQVSIVYTGSVIVVMVVYLVLLRRKDGKKSYNWEHLIDEEGKKLLLFYRVANLFIDVPALKDRAKRRRWLDGIASLIPFSQNHTYSFLYVRTFLRSGNYLGILVRLLVLGSVLLYFIPFVYGRLFVSILFLYLIGYQLLSLWKHHNLKLWVHLYPVSAEQKRWAYLRLLICLLLIGSLLFAAVLGIAAQSWSMALILLACNAVFSYIFTYVYGSRKIQALL